MYRLDQNILLIILLMALAKSFGQTKELDSLKMLIDKSDKDNINYLLAMGSYYTEESVQNIDSIAYYGNLALITAEDKFEDSEERIDAEYLLGQAESYANNYSEAIELMNKVIKNSQKIGYHKGERKATVALAEIYGIKDERLKAIKYYEKAYELVQQHKEPENIILDITVNLCSEYFQISDYNKVSELLEKAVLVIDKPSVSADTRSLFYLNAGSINLELDTNHRDKAVEQFKIALDIAEKSNNDRYQMGALMNLGLLSGKMYKYDYKEAISYYKRAIAVIKRDTVLAKHYAGVLLHLGQSYYFNKNYDSAIETFKEAKKEIDPRQEYEYTEILAFLGYAYHRRKQQKVANKYFKKASAEYYDRIENLKKNGNSKSNISWSYLRIAEMDSAQGNFQKSLANYKLFVAYKDSVDKETNLKITERIDFIKKTAEKDKKITGLTNQNNIQRLKARQQTTIGLALLIGVILLAILLAVVYNRFRLKKKALRIIKEKNQENELLMGEIHHRVKNNLQIVLSLLSAQKEHIDDETLKIALTESQNKIRSMAIIHQNLYRGNNFTKVAVDSYLGELISNIKESFGPNNKEVDFELNIDTTEIKMGLAVPLGLILNELITNCYKYAFIDIDQKKTNKVDISFKSLENSNKFKLILKDNGVGLPKDFCVENSPSFGIQLVHGLVEQLNGKIDIEVEQGTSFEIYLEEPIAA